MGKTPAGTGFSGWAYLDFEPKTPRFGWLEYVRRGRLWPSLGCLGLGMSAQGW
jgi:hypothetical protein